MRRWKDIRFDLQTNQNLSRRNIAKAYEHAKIKKPVTQNTQKGIKKLVQNIRNKIKKVLDRYFNRYWKQQIEENKILTNTLEDYDRMHTLQMEEIDYLRGTIKQLQFQIEELNRKLNIQTVFDTDGKKVRVIQIVSTMNFGDAVGNDVLAINRALKEAGYLTGVFTMQKDERVQDIDVHSLDMLPELTEKDIVIYHFASADNLEKLISELECKVVLRYHNVTPPSYFENYDDVAEMLTRKGLEEIVELKDSIDYGMTVSEFNKQDLRKMDYTCPIDVVPILIPFPDYEKTPDATIVERYSDGIKNFLFVGRIVPNKRIEDVIRCFAEYQNAYHSNARLFIVGNYQEEDKYYQFLQQYVAEHKVANVIFPGHIPFAQILAYYKIADIFLCMSEHEGFCVPLVEAMYFKVPIVAYDSTAIPGTLGGSGVLVDNKHDYEDINQKIHQILNDVTFKEQIIEKQTIRLKDFQYEKIKEELLEKIERIKETKVSKTGNNMTI